MIMLEALLVAIKWPETNTETDTKQYITDEGYWSGKQLYKSEIQIETLQYVAHKLSLIYLARRPLYRPIYPVCVHSLMDKRDLQFNAG